MKIINFTILILTVLTIYSFAQTKNFDTTFNYYPLKIGNTWDYDYGVPDSGSAFTRIIIDTINYISHNYYIIEEAYGSPPSNFINRYTRLDTLGNLWEYDNYNGEEYLRFNFTKDDSATYNWFEYSVTVYRNITIKTFAGQFENCIELFFDIPEAADDEQWFTFAPNIGIVREQYASVTQLLSSAEINGQIITEINKNQEIFNDFTLEQNYPNPFNPETMIKFELPKNSFVRLEIYNILGQKIRTLISKQITAGAHSITWDGKDDFGRNVSSGIYLYKIHTEGFAQTMKMFLLR